VKVDRTQLPELRPTRPFPFPAIEKSTLPNGMRIWTVHHTQMPLVAFTLLVRRGASSDPHGKEGLAAVTADMLDEGSGDRSAIEMHEALSRLGAQFDTDIGSDATVAIVTVLSRFSHPALALLSDVVVGPAIREHDFARVRQLRLHRLTQLRDMPGTVADRAFLKLLYGAHPYGHSPIGSEAALASMDVEDVRAFHLRAIRPSVATLIAVGDCEHEHAPLALNASDGRLVRGAGRWTWTRPTEAAQQRDQCRIGMRGGVMVLRGDRAAKKQSSDYRVRPCLISTTTTEPLPARVL